MANRELFKKIYDQITSDPDSHDQQSWSDFREDGIPDVEGSVAERDEGRCGTTRCIGGWALHFHSPDQSIFKTVWDLVGDLNVEKAAAQVLGIDDEEAEELFSESDNHEAVALVRRYAGLEA